MNSAEVVELRKHPPFVGGPAALRVACEMLVLQLTSGLVGLLDFTRILLEKTTIMKTLISSLAAIAFLAVSTPAMAGDTAAAPAPAAASAAAPADTTAAPKKATKAKKHHHKAAKKAEKTEQAPAK